MTGRFPLIVLLLATAIDVALSFSGNRLSNQCRRIPTTHLASSQSSWSEWSAKTGDSALRQVQFLASKVAESTAAGEKKGKVVGKRGRRSVRGTGGVVYNNPEFNRGPLGDADESDESSILNPSLEIKVNSKREEQVWTALANLELDSKCYCYSSIRYR
jgi:hypothetical protein